MERCEVYAELSRGKWDTDRSYRLTRLILPEAVGELPNEPNPSTVLWEWESNKGIILKCVPYITNIR